MPCTARVCMPHTMALVWRLKRVVLFPGGQRHRECTQNTYPPETCRGQGCLPDPSTPHVHRVMPHHNRKGMSRGQNSENLGRRCLDFSGKRWQKEQIKLRGPAYLVSSSAKNRERRAPQSKMPRRIPTGPASFPRQGVSSGYMQMRS